MGEGYRSCATLRPFLPPWHRPLALGAGTAWGRSILGGGGECSRRTRAAGTPALCGLSEACRWGALGERNAVLSCCKLSLLPLRMCPCAHPLGPPRWPRRQVAHRGNSPVGEVDYKPACRRGPYFLPDPPLSFRSLRVFPAPSQPPLPPTIPPQPSPPPPWAYLPPAPPAAAPQTHHKPPRPR